MEMRDIINIVENKKSIRFYGKDLTEQEFSKLVLDGIEIGSFSSDEREQEKADDAFNRYAAHIMSDEEKREWAMKAME